MGQMSLHRWDDNIHVHVNTHTHTHILVVLTCTGTLSALKKASMNSGYEYQ